MRVRVIDVGGNHVKIRATGQPEERKLDSGQDMSAAEMVEGVKQLAKGRKFDTVSIGYPGVVKNDQPVTEPHNLGAGWVASTTAPRSASG